MRRHESEDDEQYAPLPPPVIERSDSPGLPLEERIRIVTRREYAAVRGEVSCIWPSMVARACLDQPGARPSMVWVQRPVSREDFVAARAEREAKHEDKTPAVRIVCDELNRCQMRASGCWIGE